MKLIEMQRRSTAHRERKLTTVANVSSSGHGSEFRLVDRKSVNSIPKDVNWVEGNLKDILSNRGRLIKRKSN